MRAGPSAGPTDGVRLVDGARRAIATTQPVGFVLATPLTRPAYTSLNILPRKEEGSTHDDAREGQRGVGLAEADDDKG